MQLKLNKSALVVWMYAVVVASCIVDTFSPESWMDLFPAYVVLFCFCKVFLLATDRSYWHKAFLLLSLLYSIGFIFKVYHLRFAYELLMVGLLGDVVLVIILILLIKRSQGLSRQTIGEIVLCCILIATRYVTVFHSISLWVTFCSVLWVTMLSLFLSLRRDRLDLSLMLATALTQVTFALIDFAEMIVTEPAKVF